MCSRLQTLSVEPCASIVSLDFERAELAKMGTPAASSSQSLLVQFHAKLMAELGPVSFEVPPALNPDSSGELLRPELDLYEKDAGVSSRVCACDITGSADSTDSLKLATAMATVRFGPNETPTTVQLSHTLLVGPPITGRDFAQRVTLEATTALPPRRKVWLLQHTKCCLMVVLHCTHA